MWNVLSQTIYAGLSYMTLVGVEHTDSKYTFRDQEVYYVLSFMYTSILLNQIRYEVVFYEMICLEANRFK
jgi:hypothetical protein